MHAGCQVEAEAGADEAAETAEQAAAAAQEDEQAVEEEDDDEEEAPAWLLVLCPRARAFILSVLPLSAANTGLDLP